MKGLLVAALATLGLSTGCATGRVYRDGDFRLIANYTAKETCSCLFVLQQPDEFCRAWTHYDPPVATWSADKKAKTVDAALLYVFIKAKARYVNDHEGCVLE